MIFHVGLRFRRRAHAEPHSHEPGIVVERAAVRVDLEGEQAEAGRREAFGVGDEGRADTLPLMVRVDVELVDEVTGDR